MRRHVYYYTNLEQPYEALVELLGGDPGAWLPPPADASGDGWVVELRAEAALPGPLAAHLALVTVGPRNLGGPSLLRAVEWRSASAERLVPVLSGDLELAPLAGGCQLSLMGTYRPPLSVVGGAADRLLGHRVAEACARRFVLDIARRLPAATLRA